MSELGITLERPLVFFDLESTGVNVLNDRIVEIGMVKLMPDGDRIIRTKRFNPGIPIPPEAAAVHGITDADVANEPPFADFAANLATWLEGCDLGGYNLIGYDIPLLQQEMKRSGVNFSMEGRRIVDAFVIYRKMCPRDLTEAVRFYCDGRVMENAHSAEADILATVDVFAGQMRMYAGATPDTHRFPKDVTEFPTTLQGVHEFCNKKPDEWIDSTGKFKWNGSRAVVGFGVNSGTPLFEIAATKPNFLQWMLRSDFADDAKKIAKDALSGRFPEKEPPKA